jgi:phenylacetate-CoA ligase
MPTVALMGPSELYAFGDTFGDVAARIGAAHVKLWPESPRVGFAKALRLLRELAVEVVVCAPALCLNLARAARHHGYDVRRDFGVRLFGVLGEICTPELAANVTSVWGAAVCPTLYGSQEAHAIATGCRNGRLHVSQLNYLVEVLDPDTGAVRGEHGTGELCLTMLISGIKPLVRYRTGDLVSVRPGEGCGCGLAGDVVDVLGRVGDRVRIGSLACQPAELESQVLRGLRGCLGYQVVVGPDGDALTVRLDLLPELAGDVAAACESVRRRLSAWLGVPVRVEPDDRLDPITNTGAFVSWKTARIADRRVPADAAVLAARRAAAAHLVTS